MESLDFSVDWKKASNNIWYLKQTLLFMQQQELQRQFIMMGSAERGGHDSSAHQYYNMQVLHIKASLSIIKAIAAFKQKIWTTFSIISIISYIMTVHKNAFIHLNVQFI